MAVTDWIANLFQSEQTRGLSGGTASGVALDHSNPYYNYRLRRHKAEGDIVNDPALLWYTSPYVKRRSGLGPHIVSDKGEGVATFTDVLLILSLEDYSRAVNATQEPWLQTATRILIQEFDDFCHREGFSRLYAHRQLGFRILCDGSADMGGQALGLKSGEFVTGLLPNLYTGPVRGSAPVIGVHVNMPGVWDGYQEVGRLYNDQILFTLGSHWLDNFSHPALQEAALYRLQQYPDGSFVHIINPDLQDRYQVTSTDQGGASVLTLATRGGVPLAYVVLAVIDQPTAEAEAEAARPGIAIPEPVPEGPPSMAPPMLIDDAIQPIPEPAPAAATGLGVGSKTIIPDAPSERIFTLQERGALLQKVHFGAFMLGYDVYLGTRGELGTVVDDVAATFQVRRRTVALVAYVDGVTVAGRPIPPRVEVPIEGDVVIEVAGQRLEYRDLRGLRVDGWPYVGEIRRPAASTYMIWGESYKIGRSRECRVVLPDEPRNDNIHWKPSVGDGATIRARTGEIPKSRFYTDSIMVASEHSTISLGAQEPHVHCTARHCYVYVRREGGILPLYPTTSGKQPLEMDLQPGDEVLIGNCLFHVGYTPAEEAVAPAPAPRIELSADSLVDAVSSPDFDHLDAPSDPGGQASRPTPMPEPPATPVEPEDTAPAYGLGEVGTAPKPVPLQPVGLDSILGVGEEPPEPEPIDEDEPTVPDAPVPPELAEPVPLSAKKQKTLQLYDDDDEDESIEPPPPIAPPPVPAPQPPPVPVVDDDEGEGDDITWQPGEDWEQDQEVWDADEDPSVEPFEPSPLQADALAEVPPLPEERPLPPPPPLDERPLPPPPPLDEPLPPPVPVVDEPPPPPEPPEPPPVADEEYDEDYDEEYDGEYDEDYTGDDDEDFTAYDDEDDSGVQDETTWERVEPVEDVMEAPSLPEPAAVEEPPAPEEPPPPVVEEPPLPVVEEPPPPVVEEPPAPVVEPPPPVVEPPPPVAEEPPPVAEEPPLPVADEPPLPVAEEPPPPTPEPPPPAVEPPPPAVEPPPAAEPPVDEDSPWGTVIFVDDEDAQFELSRRLQLVQTGWMVNGEMICGNHTKADLVLPENRLDPDQEFQPCDYFLVKIRGRRGHIDILAPEEVLVDGDIATQERYDKPEDITLEVIRRDDRGDEDFAVPLVLIQDRRLPDPRAKLLLMDYEDPLAAALVTRGLPTRAERRLEIGGVEMTAYDTGEGEVIISNYLETYQTADGFRPFFVQKGGARFKTAPEDGSDFSIEPDDRLVVGTAVYVLRDE